MGRSGRIRIEGCDRCHGKVPMSLGNVIWVQNTGLTGGRAQVRFRDLSGGSGLTFRALCPLKVRAEVGSKHTHLWVRGRWAHPGRGVLMALTSPWWSFITGTGKRASRTLAWAQDPGNAPRIFPPWWSLSITRGISGVLENLSSSFMIYLSRSSNWGYFLSKRCYSSTEIWNSLLGSPCS